MSSLSGSSRVFIVSDLHLGGEDGFRMCAPERGLRRLERFARFVADHRPSKTADVDLILNGDVVDFLAEKPFEVLTPSDEGATQKLGSVIERTEPFWNAIASAATRGVRTTILVGNHDVELSFPGCRRLLKRRLGREIELLLDGEALTIGSMLIEHGNRYDSWNVVPHGDVRAFRSAMSRGESAPVPAGVPGSHLVVDVMNSLKRDYPLIDLLKPEAAAVLLIAFLEPARIVEIRRIFGPFLASRMNRHGPRGEPRAVQNISGLDRPRSIAGSHLHDEALELADQVAEATSRVGSPVQVVQPIGVRPRGPSHGAASILLNALRHILREDSSFDLARESETYLRPARAAHERGFEVVVYGHTHLAKKQRLDRGWYLNSGTWADLVRIPNDVRSEDDQVALPALLTFLERVRGGRERELRATFVDVRVGDDAPAKPVLAELGDDGSVITLGDSP